MLYHNFIKHFIDRSLAALGLVITLPVTVPTALALAYVNRGSPFFLQVRPGLNERFFRIIKFKTMSDRRDKDGNPLPDAQRLTPLGRWTRRTSLDEIPQLLNVLAGHMSLIGPRPLLPEYLPLYSAVQRRRHAVRPGITGWAQVNGRNAISWSQKFEYDVWYVDHLSWRVDLEILVRTIGKVFRSEGISEQGEATASPFVGNG